MSIRSLGQVLVKYESLTAEEQGVSILTAVDKKLTGILASCQKIDILS